MSRFTSMRRPRLLGVSSLAVLAAIGLSAQAQHLSYLAPTTQDVAVQKANLSLKTDSDIAQEIQQSFMDKSFEAVFDDKFEDDVILAARLAYANDLFEPVWTRKGAKELAEIAADPSEFGLKETEFAALDVDKIAETRFGSKSFEDQARADLELTAAWLTIASRISGGLSEAGEAKSAPEAGPARPQLTSALVKSGEGAVEKALQAYEPSHPQYQVLKTALESYQTIAAEGGWKALPSDGETLEPGMIDMRVPALRGRLIAEGYYPAQQLMAAFAGAISEGLKPKTVAATEDESDDELSDFETWLVTYDESLEKAVKSFQGRHGLAVDGVLGAKTLEALNESVESKITRIERSMDEWRAEADFGERYVWANIPSYRVEGWANGRREISMKSIVGLPSRKTPAFSDEIEYTVANPRWYAPKSIVARDKLPKLQRDPSYAARNGYSIYDRATGDKVSAQTVDWSDPSAAQTYQFVQAAGSGNALGQLKIMFPNRHSVYLHGTPDTHLFERDERALSSGCVRLEDPVGMAEWIAKTAGLEGDQTVTEAVESRRNQRLDFSTTMPVHITYFTVTADDEGLPYFWRDIYREEAPISAATEIAELYVPVSEREKDDAPMKLAGSDKDANISTLN